MTVSSVSSTLSTYQTDVQSPWNQSVQAFKALKITTFLEQNAGRERSSSAQPVLRISETRWFVHEHDEVPSSVWKSAKVKSPSNCSACHSNAEQGDFSEHSVHIPK